MALPNGDTKTSTEQWTIVITKCFQNRLQPERLNSALTELSNSHRIPGRKLAEIVLVSGAQPITGIDPLVPAYIGLVLDLRLLNVGDVLAALLLQSRYSPKNTAGSDDSRPSTVTYPLLETIFTLLANHFLSGKWPETAFESIGTFMILGTWLKACNTYETVMQIQTEGLHAPEAELVHVFEALGTCISVFFNVAAVKKHVGQVKNQEIRTRFSEALGHFASTLSQWLTTQIPTRLQTIARTSPLSVPTGTLDASMSDISNAVIDLPILTSKAGLYIHLKAALCSRPLLDDASLINMLHARYPSDAQAMLVDLIRASFDVLADALRRQESEHAIFCFRSFVANKLPLIILSSTAGLYLDVTPDFAVSIGIGRILQFPPPDSGHITDVLGESEKDFVQACHLHQVISDNVVNGALREYAPANTPRTTRHVKDILVTQCISNVHRVEELIQELDGMRGNAGAISMALSETLQRLCNSKETMSLRTLCNAMSRRLPLMDVMLQYVRATDVLLPLCSLLNDWQIEEDQSEYQPPYEEFASVLLLVLAIVHRYNLNVEDLGASGSDNFVVKLLEHLSESTPTNQLNEEQNKHLTKWVQGLYATDDQGESSGISDETMSQCPPQAFYLLVPTLFEQSVQACQAGALSSNTLKGGLEFLLEPFLLPSLVGGLSWLARHSWEDHGDANILIQVLNKLLRPQSISGDAQSMHQTILGIVARPLEQSLQELNRRVPNIKELSLLIDVLKPHVDSQRCSNSSMAEIRSWTINIEGGLRSCIANLVAQLTTWSSWISQPEMGTTPTTYSHRMIHAANSIIGADDVLLVIVDQVTKQTALGMGPGALEVATALILAPSTDASIPTARPIPNLRRALKLRLSDAKDLVNMEVELVETLVRIGRLVDRQSAISPAAQLPMPLTNIGTEELMQGMDMSGADMGTNQVSLDQTNTMTEAAAADFAAAMDQPLDLTASAPGDLGSIGADMDMDNLFAPSQDIDFGLDVGTQQQQQTGQIASFDQSASNAQVSNDEDIFAGLDLGDMGGMGDMGDDDFGF